MYKCEDDKEREHLVDDGRNRDELPDLIFQNTQTNIKAHKNKPKIKAHKTHKNKNMIQEGLEVDYS